MARYGRHFINFTAEFDGRKYSNLKAFLDAYLQRLFASIWLLRIGQVRHAIMRSLRLVCLIKLQYAIVFTENYMCVNKGVRKRFLKHFNKYSLSRLSATITFTNQNHTNQDNTEKPKIEIKPQSIFNRNGKWIWRTLETHKQSHVKIVI